MTTTTRTRTTRVGLTFVGSLAGAATGLVITVVLVLLTAGLLTTASSADLASGQATDVAAFRLPLMALAAMLGIVAGGSIGRDLTRWWLRAG